MTLAQLLDLTNALAIAAEEAIGCEETETESRNLKRLLARYWEASEEISLKGLR